MNELHHLLDRAAGEPVSATADADLARGRIALSRTRRRRGAVGLVGLAAASVVGVGATRVLDDTASPRPEADRSVAVDDVSPDTTGVQLLASPLSAGPYTFATTPEGWSVQGARPQAVTIAPDDGSVSDHPDDFRGKLVIMLDTNRPAGDEVTVDGRTFWLTGDSGYQRVSTRTLPGEPEGVVMVQYPESSGWSVDTMLEFLGSVQVGDGAVPGVG